MAQLPLVVGDVYLLGGVARLKVTVSSEGAPVTGLTPFVTIIRDSDGFAANFVTKVFEAFTPASIVTPPYSAPLTEVAFGTYFRDFDPSDFSSTNEEVYTVIFHHEVAPNPFVTHSEFTFSNSLGAKLSTGFGLLNRCCNVCVQMPTTIMYQTLSGQSDVELTIFNPFNEVVIAAVPMIELNDTGIYQFTHTFAIQGEHTIIVSEDTHGSTDAMVITVGGAADRLKRIEEMLRSLISNPPSVSPCE